MSQVEMIDELQQAFDLAYEDFLLEEGHEDTPDIRIGFFITARRELKAAPMSDKDVQDAMIKFFEDKVDEAAKDVDNPVVKQMIESLRI
jgi:hypothetical protein